MLNKFWNLVVILTLFSSASLQPRGMLAETVPVEKSGALEALPAWARPPAPSPLRYLPLFIPGFEPAVVDSEIQGLSGSSVSASDCYLPGITLPLCFTAHNASDDVEWLDGVSLTLPAGWTAACNSQDASDSGGNAVSFDCAADANSLSYADNDGGWGEIYGGQGWGFCVDVVAPGDAAGSQALSWSLSGDEYGAAPHDLSGQLTLAQCALPQWSKLLDGAAWTPGLLLTRETSDTLTVTDVLSAQQDLQLLEQWDADKLALLDYNIAPPGAGSVSASERELTWTLTGGGPYTLTRSLRVAPSSWLTTALSETLLVAGQPFETRPVTLAKQPPNLLLDSAYEPLIYQDMAGAFTLLYRNNGGYENDAWVWSDLPAEVLFVGSEPMPDDLDSFPQRIGWNVGDLASGTQGSIDVYVVVSATLGSVQIRDAICDHLGVERDSTLVTLQVTTTGDVVWGKFINDDLLWESRGRVTVQTSDVVTVVNNVIAGGVGLDFALSESWNTAELELIDQDPAGMVLSIGDGTLQGNGDTMGYLETYFRVQPSAWTDTVLWEEFTVDSGPVFQRPLFIEKLSAVLWINSAYDNQVQPGQGAVFTLTFGNSGGYENDVMLRNEFPPEAPFVAATPSPDRSAPDGSWVEWDLGDLAQDASGSIAVSVAITDSLLPSTTLQIWDYIYDHARVVQDAVATSLHYPFPPAAWTKTINGQQTWTPGLAVTAQASDTLSIADAITTAAAFELVETWDPAQLEFQDYVPPLEGSVVVGNGVLTWTAPAAGEETLATIVKNFHVRPCTWTESLVQENLWVEGALYAARPLTVAKQLPALWLTSQYQSHVTVGQQADLLLVYGNAGGREYDAWVRSDFSPQAPFVSATPGPDRFGDGSWAEWDLDQLASGEQGRITVTVAVTASLLPSTTTDIWGRIYDHVGVEQDDARITFSPYPFTWTESVNGQALDELVSLTLQTADSVVVVDVITTAGAPLQLFARWQDERLELQDYWLSPGFSGDVGQGQGLLTLTVASGVAQIITLTRLFEVQPRTWTASLLKQDLWLGGQLYAKRGAWINKDLPDLWISSDTAYHYAYAGETSVFTLRYGNRGGRETAVMLRSDLGAGALFAQALPAPTRVATDAAWAEWDVGTLAGGAAQSITVAVALSAGLGVSSSVEIWNRIYDHAETEQDSISTTFHVTAPPPLTWYKQAGGALWTPDLNLAVETSDLLEIVDVFGSTGAPYTLTEQWNPGRLALDGWTLQPPSAGDVSTATGDLTLSISDPAETITLTKLFLVQPCTWTETSVQEQLWYQGYPQALQRPVFITKLASDLWLAGRYTALVTSGQAATFTLDYGNAGGYENAVWIEALLPPQASFDSSQPPADDASPGGSQAMWNVGDLALDQQGSLLVTVTVSAGLPPSTTISIWDGIYNHAGALMDQITTTYFTTPPTEPPCAPVLISDVLASPDGCVVDFAPLYSGDPPITWTWNFMGGVPVSSNLENPRVDFGSSGHYPYTLDAVNCGGDGQDAYNDSVTVNCAACTRIAAAYLDYSPARPLAGRAITFTASVSPSAATPPITYTWSFGEVGPTVTQSFPLTTTTQVYTVSVTARNACPSQAAANRAVTVYPNQRVYLPLALKH